MVNQERVVSCLTTSEAPLGRDLIKYTLVTL